MGEEQKLQELKRKLAYVDKQYAKLTIRYEGLKQERAKFKEKLGLIIADLEEFNQCHEYLMISRIIRDFERLCHAGKQEVES